MPTQAARGHLTSFEKQQPHSVFVHAGKLGFLIGVSFNGNPYPVEPFRSLWAKGHAQAKYEYDVTFIAAGKAAFTADLTLEDNPYRGGQKRVLWMKGWWKAKHQADDKARPKRLRFDTKGSAYRVHPPLKWTQKPKDRRGRP